MIAEQTKYCSGCRLDRPVGDFYARRDRPVGLQARCKICTNKTRWKNGRIRDEEHRKRVNRQNRESYERNKATVLERQRKWRANESEKFARRKLAALSIVGEPRCIHCGEDHPAVLQFHHRDPSTKLFNVSVRLGKGNVDWEEIYDEVLSCDVVCSNCHDKIHFGGRFKWWEFEVKKAKDQNQVFLGVDKLDE